jgi:hypothetical protein
VADEHLFCCETLHCSNVLAFSDMAHCKAWTARFMSCSKSTQRSRRRPLFHPCNATSTHLLGSHDESSKHMNSDGPKRRTEADIRGAKLRAFIFFTVSMLLAVPLFLVMSILYPAVMLFDRYRRRAEHVANRVWAALSTLPFVRVQVPMVTRLRFSFVLCFS